MDAGEILFTEKIQITAEDEAQSLAEKLTALGSRLLPRVLLDFAEGKIIPQAQDEATASYCRKITKAEGEILWEQFTAEGIVRRVKALAGRGGAFTFWRGERLKILQSERLQGGADINYPSGTVFEHAKKICVAAKEGSVVLEIIQPEGKRAMRAEEFVAGRREFVGSKLV
jgi:methionyl-tRNA formyltransferase